MASPADSDKFSDKSEMEEMDRRSAGINPLTRPYPWWYELYKRIKLIPWWLSYNLGFAKEAGLKNKIIELACSLGLQDNWVKKVVRHAVSEFSKKGLGRDYYGYHTIDHELEATYFTVLAAKGLKDSNELTYNDICYLFLSALFHDFDPLKEFDKPNEEYIESFLRSDARIQGFIQEAGINIDIVMALIHRTAYPFVGEIREKAEKRMRELFTSAGIPEQDLKTRKHYEDLGWFLSVSERIAGYALDDFARSTELAKRNAHALGWHPSVINMESVKYFSVLKEEKEMYDLVMQGVPEDYRKRFDNNVAGFREAWQKEVEIRSSVRKKEVEPVPVVETLANGVDSDLKETLLKLYMTLPPPIRLEENDFFKSLVRNDTLLVTLRNKDGSLVGYAKGGPLEYYKLRRGTIDENKGKRNTIYLEPMSMEPGYWGSEFNYGSQMRKTFLKEAKKRGCKFVSAYAHREWIRRRKKRGESIETVCPYDPDRYDYYRINLDKLNVEEMSISSVEGSERESMEG